MLAVIMGVIFAVLGAPVSAWLIGSSMPPGFSGFFYSPFLVGIVVYVINVLFAVALIKLGATWVPDYDQLFKAIENVEREK